MRGFIDGTYVELPPDEIAEVQRNALLNKIQERTRTLSFEEVLLLVIPQTINAVDVDDNTALRMIGFYPEWTTGVAYAMDYKVQRNGKLWKVLQAHTSQSGWEPENAASLWTEICETHDGTESDPIPYSGNMALVYGLYYIQDEHLYRCTRDTGNPVYHALADLVGQYVELVG